MSERIYPSELYPTILEGFIYGDTIRFESLEGPEIFLGFNELVKESGSATWWRWRGGFKLSGFKPFVYSGNGKTYSVTHLQKQSQRGYLKTSPDCYHRWFWIRKQQKDANGNWIPGTEIGFYFRKPFSWRWDILGTIIEGILRHWIWTKGYLNRHWD